MANITGYKAAKVGEIKPFELPINEMATGIQATQKRADDAKNAMLAGASALAVETRALQEDWDTAQNVRSEYRDAVNKLAEEAGGDWSKIDMSQIQSKAIDYAQDNRVRQLTSAKQNADQYSELRHKIEVDNGEVLSFGLDPTTIPLYAENGEPTNFPAWQLEGKLDHVKEARDLFTGLGHTSGADVDYDPAVHGDFYQYWMKHRESWRNNTSQIQSVIDNGLYDYKKTKAGGQYYRQIMQELNKEGKTGDVAEQEANKRLENLIFWSGKHQEIIEKDEEKEMKILQKPKPEVVKPPSRGTKKGGSGKEPEPTVVQPSATPLKITLGGVNLESNATPHALIEQMTSNTVDVTHLDQLEYNQVTNTNAFDVKMLEVGNTGEENKADGDIRIVGSLQSLDNELFKSNNSGKENRAIIRVSDVIDSKTVEIAEKLTGQDLTKVAELSDFVFSVQDYKRAAGKVGDHDNAYYNNGLLSKVKGGNTYMSMFEVDTEESDGDPSVKFQINPVMQQILNDQEEIMNDETSSPSEKALAGLKFTRLSKKIEDSNKFLEDHKDALHKMVNHKKSLLHKVNRFKTFNENLMNQAGMTREQKDALKGQEGTLNSEKYADGRVKGISEGIYQLTGTTKYNDIWNLIKDVKGKDSKDDAQLTKAWNFYSKTWDKILKGELKKDEVVNTFKKAGVAPERIKQILASKAWQPEYVSSKLEQEGLLEDHKYNKIKHEMKVSLSNSRKFFDFDDNGNAKVIKANIFVPLSDNPTFKEVQQIYNQNLKQGVEVGMKGSDKEVRRYYDLLQESQNELNVDRLVYFGEVKDREKNHQIITKLEKSLDLALLGKTKKIKEIFYDEFGTDKVTPEEFDHNLIFQERERLIEASKGKTGVETLSPEDAMKQILSVKGIFFDEDNEKQPFNIAFSVRLPTENGGTVDKLLEVEYEPTRTELQMMGYTARHANYLPKIRQGLEENNNLFFDFKEETGNTTRFYRANRNIDSHKIKKGQYYVIGDGDPKNSFNVNGTLTPYTSQTAMIDYHVSRSHKNVAYQNKLTSIYKQMSNGVPAEYFGLKEGTTKEDVYDWLLEANGEVKAMEMTDPVGSFGTENIKPGDQGREAKLERTKIIANGNDEVVLAENGTYQFNEDADLTNPKLLKYAYSINPSLAGMKWYHDDEGEQYLTDPNSLEEVNIESMNNIAKAGPGVKVKLEPELKVFLNEMDNILTLFNQNKMDELKEIFSDYNMDSREVDFNMLNPSKYKNSDGVSGVYPLTITSGLRSLEDNMHAYRKDLSSLTVSNHMRGKSIDIRTGELGNAAGDDQKTGRAMWEFFKTPVGQELLRQNGLRALMHNAGTGDHIDISFASDSYPAGTVVEQPKGGSPTYYGTKPNELKKRK